MNYPALKEGASHFNGTRQDRGFTPSYWTDGASMRSTNDSRRYHALGLMADVLGGIDVPIMPGAAPIISPQANLQRQRGLSTGYPHRDPISI